MKNNKLRVAIGLSGGVDSSVAAALLKERRYDVVGVTMTNFDPSRPGGSAEKHGCYGPNEEEEVDTAADVCKRLHICQRIKRIFFIDSQPGSFPIPCFP